MKNKDVEQIHIYVRQKENGRIITHFLYPLKEWEELEEYAKEQDKSIDQLLAETIKKWHDAIK